LKNLGKISLGVALLLIGLIVYQVARPARPPAARPALAPSNGENTVVVSPTNARDSRAPRAIPLPADKREDRVPEFEDSWAKELRQLKELAAKDPDAALSKVSQMGEKHERKEAAERVCLVVAEKNPAKAMTAAWNLELGLMANESAENETLERLAKQWANADLVKAFVWASALPPDEESRRDHIIKGIASAVSQITPSVAARMVTEQMRPDSSVKVEATLEVLRQWAARDYAGALAWAAVFPEGPLRERGLEELASVGSESTHTKPKPN